MGNLSSFRISPGEWRLTLLVGVLGGLAYASVGSGDIGAANATPGPTVASPAAVRVIDGDTFHYGAETIRIADIDTPEVRARCAYEADLAARATRRMRALLAEGPFELRSIDRDEDRYGRKLRVVVRDGRSLGDVLVSEGLARTWTGRRLPWCA